MRAALMKGSCWAENVEWLLIRGATSLKGCCCRVDGAILSLTHSGKITALNNSCTDTPLSLSCRYITIYTPSHGQGRDPRFDRLWTFQRSAPSICSEGLIENRIAVEIDQRLQMFVIG